MNRITWRAILTGIVVSAVFAFVTVYFGNKRGLFPTSTQLPVLPYVLLVLTVLLINPLCRLIRFVRPFTAVEILAVFMMGMVPSGVSTFGLSAQLVPLTGSLYNNVWYNDQSRWSQYLAPVLPGEYFLGERGLQTSAIAYSAKRTSGGDALEERMRLAELEGKAFQKTSLFRRGLPRAAERRTIPGLLRKVPWSQWLGPLAHWGLLIVLTYAMLMSFNVLVLRQWAEHEKLQYPLAELPKMLSGGSEDAGGIVPRVYRSGFFWAGFAVSGLFLGWNVLSALELIPGLKPFDFRHYWRPFIEQTSLQALMPDTRSEIFFTMIGLSFLLPRSISFSLWFFQVLALVQLLLLVWSGHGVNESSFPVESWFTMNFRTAEGGGALLVFSSVIFYRCRKHIFCAFFPACTEGLERDERTELRISSFIFMVCSLAVVLVLWLGMGANPWYSAAYLLVILLISVGLMRAVAEGGVLAVQVQAGPFHILKTLLGLDRAWTAPSLIAPLMVFHAVMFMDAKTFIAPAMANALKIRSDLRMKRLNFHLSIAGAILVSAVVAVSAEIAMSYSVGADNMNAWFYNHNPNLYTYGQIAASSSAPPHSDPANSLWFGGGAVVMAGLLYLRGMLAWIPHPIGMIMLVNPLMKAYWFSILLGWLAKTIVTRYGSKDLYARAKTLFIGLIAGELAVIACSMMLTAVFGVGLSETLSIDLNR